MLRRIALAACFAVGCGHKDTAAPPPPPAPAQGLRVLAQGIEPRTLLHYQIVKGTTTDLDMTGETDLGAGSDRVPWPGIKTTSELGADDVAADGTMKVRYTVRSASAVDRPGAQITAAQMTTPLQDLVGTSIVGSLSPTGVLTGLAVDTGGKQLPPALAGQVEVLTRALDRMVMPLPDMPVGVGAKWSFVQHLDQTGIKLEATTTIQATVITPTTVTMTLVSTLTGPDQDTAAAGPKVRISKLSGTMTGSGTIDLVRLTYAGTLEATLKMDLTADGQTEPSGMTSRLTFVPKRYGAQNPP